MALDRETTTEILVSVVSVGLFIAAVVFVGGTYNSDGLTSQGAFALIGSIVGFILLMTVVAVFLSRQ